MTIRQTNDLLKPIIDPLIMAGQVSVTNEGPSSNFHWIWTRFSAVRPDGAIHFKTSGFDQGESHWSSQEEFSCSDELYPSMKWIFENRLSLPSLIGRNLVPVDLSREAPLRVPPDGVYALCEEMLVEAWSASLGVPVSVICPEDASPDFQLLMKLTGANCFLFVHGVCEDAISVGDGSSDRHLTPKQALQFLKSTLDQT